MTPCPSDEERPWLTNLDAPLRADLPGSDICLVYMPWTWTPVVPTCLRTVGAAFASSYWLGHHGNACLSGLDTFTLDALRPAHSLSTLRGVPRDTATRKTRYREGIRRSQLIAAPPIPCFRGRDLHPLADASFAWRTRRDGRMAA